MAFNFPASPSVGALFSPVGGVTYQWNGTVWLLVVPALSPVEEVVGGMITIGTSAPSTPAVNDVWIDTT